MRKRKLILSGLFLVSALTIMTPSVRGDGQGGGDSGKDRPRWPPVRGEAAVVQVNDIEPQYTDADQSFSLQSLWNYLAGLFK